MYAYTSTFLLYPVLLRGSASAYKLPDDSALVLTLLLPSFGLSRLTLFHPTSWGSDMMISSISMSILRDAFLFAVKNGERRRVPPGPCVFLLGVALQ